VLKTTKLRIMDHAEPLSRCIQRGSADTNTQGKKKQSVMAQTSDIFETLFNRGVSSYVVGVRHKLTESPMNLTASAARPPLIIHVIVESPSCIDEAFHDNFHSWVRHHSNIEMRIYSDSGMKMFFAEYIANEANLVRRAAVQRMLHSIVYGAETRVRLAEAFGVFVLEAHGGLLVDLHAKCLASWEPILERFGSVLALEPKSRNWGSIELLYSDAKRRVTNFIETYNSQNRLLSSLMGTNKKHSRMFKAMSNFMISFVNDNPGRALDVVDNETLKHVAAPLYIFAEHWFGSMPCNSTMGAVLGSHVVALPCKGCLSARNDQFYKSTGKCRNILELAGKAHVRIFHQRKSEHRSFTLKQNFS